MPAASRPRKSRRPSGTRRGSPRLDRRAWPRLHGQPVHPFTPQARTACPGGADLAGVARSGRHPSSRGSGRWWARRAIRSTGSPCPVWRVAPVSCDIAACDDVIEPVTPGAVYVRQSPHSGRAERPWRQPRRRRRAGRVADPAGTRDRPGAGRYPRRTLTKSAPSATLVGSCVPSFSAPT